MDVPHRLSMVSSDPRSRGEAGGQPTFGGAWLVISALVLLAVSAVVFLFC